MTDASPPRRRRPRSPVLPRADLDGIGAAINRRVPPPIPPGLGEGLLERASQEDDPMHNPQIEGLLGRLLEKSESNGRALDDVQKNMRRLDERLDGVAYRRDIEAFMHRDEIERRIDKAIGGMKEETKESLGGIRKDVGRLQSIVVWAGGGIIAAFAALLLKLIYSSAHLPM